MLRSDAGKQIGRGIALIGLAEALDGTWLAAFAAAMHVGHVRRTAQSVRKQGC